LVNNSLAICFGKPRQLRGEPCGGVWGTPVDVDASSRAIWVAPWLKRTGRITWRWKMVHDSSMIHLELGEFEDVCPLSDEFKFIDYDR